jgi:cobalt-zinc-cadmium resistance protein CzcA
MRRKTRDHRRRGRALRGSLGLAPFLGAEFIPRLDEGAIAMQIWRLPSISLEQSNALSTRPSGACVEEFPNEVETVVSRTGRAEIATDPMGVEISDTYIMLNPPETWRFADKEALVEAIDDALKAVPGGDLQLLAAHRAAGGRADLRRAFGRRRPRLRRRSRTLLKTKADEVAAVCRKIPGPPRPRPNRRRPAAAARAHRPRGARALRDQRRGRARRGRGHRRQAWWAPSSRGSSASTCRCASPRACAPTSRRIRDLRVAGPRAAGGPRGSSRCPSWRDRPRGRPGADQPRRHQPAHQRRGQRARPRPGLVRGRGAGRRPTPVEAAAGWSVEWGGQFENLEAASSGWRSSSRWRCC